MVGDGEGNTDEGWSGRLGVSDLGCWVEEGGGVVEGSFVVVGGFGIGVLMTRGMMRYKGRTCREILKDILGFGFGSVGFFGMYLLGNRICLKNVGDEDENQEI